MRTWTVELLEPEAYEALNVRDQSGVCGNSQSGYDLTKVQIKGAVKPVVASGDITTTKIYNIW